MNTQRYNPNLDQRRNKPNPSNSELKENEFFSDGFRDGYIYNNPNSRWGNKTGRLNFADLNYKREFDQRRN